MKIRVREVFYNEHYVSYGITNQLLIRLGEGIREGEREIEGLTRDLIGTLIALFGERNPRSLSPTSLDVDRQYLLAGTSGASIVVQHLPGYLHLLGATIVYLLQGQREVPLNWRILPGLGSALESTKSCMPVRTCVALQMEEI